MDALTKAVEEIKSDVKKLMAKEVTIPFLRRPLYELIAYNPSVLTSGDLEAGATAIAVAAKPANAQYTSAALTIPVPTDSRLAISRVATRMSIIVDSFNAGCAHLYVQCYVDDATGLVAARQLFSIDIAAPGTSLSVQEVTSAVKADIFNLLKNGAGHTFHFFLWVDAGNAVVSGVQVWEGIGAAGATGGGNPCLTLSHKGWVSVSSTQTKIGTGNVAPAIFYGISALDLLTGNRLRAAVVATELSGADNTGFTVVGIQFSIFSSVATDLAYVEYIKFNLRSD